jgi:hypothetical protein
MQANYGAATVRRNLLRLWVKNGCGGRWYGTSAVPQTADDFGAPRKSAKWAKGGHRLRGWSSCGEKISSTRLRNSAAIAKARERLASYRPVSIAFTVWRDTSSFSARSACVHPRVARSSGRQINHAQAWHYRHQNENRSCYSCLTAGSSRRLVVAARNAEPPLHCFGGQNAALDRPKDAREGIGGRRR